jgi:hypothetical protein
MVAVDHRSDRVCFSSSVKGRFGLATFIFVVLIVFTAQEFLHVARNQVGRLIFRKMPVPLSPVQFELNHFLHDPSGFGTLFPASLIEAGDFLVHQKISWIE